MNHLKSSVCVTAFVAVHLVSRLGGATPPAPHAPAAAGVAAAPALGTAAGFAVLGGSTVTSIGGTALVGSLGVAPGLAVTGFPPGIVSGGTIHAGDAVAQQAQTDFVAASVAVAGDACGTDLSGQDLGGLTLTPGVYCFSAAAQLTGTLQLDAQGNADAVFVIQIGSTLTTAVGASVVFTNAGQACNVYWNIGTSATIGAGTAFIGNLFAAVSITLSSGANVAGRALAHSGAVTMDANAVALGVCQASGSSSGDPHLMTFDGLFYDLMATGDFVLARAPGVLVEVRQSRLVPSSNVSSNVAAAARFGSDSVAVFTAPFRVLVNGSPTTLAWTDQLLPGGSTLSIAGTNVRVANALGSVTFRVHVEKAIDIVVRLAPTVTDVSGLLGDRDGHADNDLIARGGQVLREPVTFDQAYHVFAASWVVPPAESLFTTAGDETPSPSFQVPSDAASVVDVAPEAWRVAEQVCVNAGILRPALLAACTLDVASTGDSTAAEVFATLRDPSLVLTVGDGIADRPSQPAQTPEVSALAGTDLPSGCTAFRGESPMPTSFLLMAAFALFALRRRGGSVRQEAREVAGSGR